ncbi:hypothetical protein KKC32_02905 [Patescibacteria group bacterium]|nr:hypothetical protein [Patescibacteria group bacterium]
MKDETSQAKQETTAAEAPELKKEQTPQAKAFELTEEASVLSAKEEGLEQEAADLKLEDEIEAFSNAVKDAGFGSVAAKLILIARNLPDKKKEIKDLVGILPALKKEKLQGETARRYALIAQEIIKKSKEELSEKGINI